MTVDQAPYSYSDATASPKIGFIRHRYAGAAAAGLAAFGTFLPWVTLGPLSVSGSQTDYGKMLAVLALVGAVMAGVALQEAGVGVAQRATEALCAVGATGMAIYASARIWQGIHGAGGDVASFFGISPSIGAGMVLSLAGSAAWVASVVLRESTGRELIDAQTSTASADGADIDLGDEAEAEAWFEVESAAIEANAKHEAYESTTRFIGFIAAVVVIGVLAVVGMVIF